MQADALKILWDVVNEEKLDHKLHPKYAAHADVIFLELQDFAMNIFSLFGFILYCLEKVPSGTTAWNNYI